MKLEVKARILSACLALSILVTACGSTTENYDTETVNVEKVTTEVVASPAESTEIAEESTEVMSEEVVTLELTAEEREWQNSMMPDVNDSLNVRAEGNEEAEIVGRLAKGDRATVIEVGDEWTKISSGNVEGYVKNSYCIYGTEALAYAKENCDTVATTTTGSLRMREEMSTDSKIIKTLEEGKELIVDTSAETNEEWVAIKYGDNTYYVSAEFVDVKLKTGTGLTTDEIAAIEKAKVEEKAAEAKAKAKAAEKAASNNASLASIDDHTLLAAIISCEAGGESYETQLAVGAVVMNRLRAGYGGSIADVLTKKGQFPPATNGTLARKIASGKISSTSYEAASVALAGQDNTYGCRNFNRNNGTRVGIVYGSMVFW